MSVHPIDLHLRDLPGVISSWLILDDEPALVDPGPASTLPRLREALSGFGLAPRDLRHLLLTHVHMDHAGAAGDLVAANPEMRVYVHRDGAPHMAEPEKLVASTRRTFGAAHDALWGPMRPVPRDALRLWEPRRPGPIRRVRVVPTPGHIGHHLAYLHEHEGMVFTGDALGIVLTPAAPTHPPTPPPAVDLDAWRQTLVELRGLGAERAGVAHFGLHTDVEARTHQLAEALDRLESRVRQALETGREAQDARAFHEESLEALAEVAPKEWVERYYEVFRAENDWKGVQRWVETTSAQGEGDQ
jgi:glyoxylase-like metal-dependent hydrolase (beta-lactamase superfamily II)